MSQGEFKLNVAAGMTFSSVRDHVGVTTVRPALMKQKYIAVYWKISCNILGNIFSYMGFNIDIFQYIAIYA